jgi:hypothetical protein
MTDLDAREALIAMRLFLERFYAEAGNDMETLIADITIESDGGTGDPAAWNDWLQCVDAVKAERQEH